MQLNRRIYDFFHDNFTFFWSTNIYLKKEKKFPSGREVSGQLSQNLWIEENFESHSFPALFRNLKFKKMKNEIGRLEKEWNSRKQLHCVNARTSVVQINFSLFLSLWTVLRTEKKRIEEKTRRMRLSYN